jgi:hypothetical protein
MPARSSSSVGHEGEVGGIEEEDRPLALHVLVGDVDELAFLESGCLKRLDAGVDESHGLSSSFLGLLLPDLCRGVAG